jgi:hypothetical protein
MFKKTLVILFTSFVAMNANAQLKSAKALSITNYAECYHVLGLYKITAQQNGNAANMRAYDHLQLDWIAGGSERFGEKEAVSNFNNKNTFNKVIKMTDAQLLNLKNNCIQYYPKDYK